MARPKKTESERVCETLARALVDIPALGAKSGELITADAEVIAALVQAGIADNHPEAIAHARAGIN